MRQLLLFLVSLICLTSLAQGKKVLYTFNTNNFEVIDSIAAGYNSNNESAAEIINIPVKDGQIEASVNRFKASVDSLSKIYPDFNYAIAGVSVDGGIAATVSAAASNPRCIVLISAPGIGVDKIVTRLFSSALYLYIPYDEDMLTFRKMLMNEIALSTSDSIANLSIIPIELARLVKYQPDWYLQQLKCPVFTAFGASDRLLEWYENCHNMVSVLPQTADNKVRVFAGTDHALLSTETLHNLPFIGDPSPKMMEPKPVNMSAASEIIDWLRTNFH